VQKQAPTVGRIMVMAIFTLSCFGLLLYLWAAFGGPIPLKPHGYRFHATFAEATQLAQEADVRISGVNVGKVKEIDLDEGAGRTDAIIEVEEEYAPISKDSRAILRQKTLLGETYVELTPGTQSAGKIPEGGRLETAQVAPTVELDEILRSLDKQTREGFQIWQQDLGKGIENHGEDFSDFLGVLPEFANNTNEVLKILNSQERATKEAIKNTGVVFDALTERGNQLRDWITTSNRLLETTARRDDRIRAIWREFPEFITQSQTALRRLERYAVNTDPLMRDLRPVGTQLSNLFINAGKLAPDFKGFFVGLNRLIPASRRGLPAQSRFLDQTRDTLAQLDPFLRNFNPFLRFLGQYRRELAAMLANDTAVTQATDQIGQDRVHYLRLTSPVNPSSLATYPRPQGWFRGNPYYKPGAYNQLRQGLPVFNADRCGATEFPTISPTNLAGEFRDRIILYVLNRGQTVAPPCREQGPFTNADKGAPSQTPPASGEATDYPHVRPDPRPSP
jgi:phospholipid/cholesterol/gamma-HCH transport system substrate-binding protein